MSINHSNYSRILVKGNCLLSHPFRIFFLLGSLYAILMVFAWVAILFGFIVLPLTWSPVYWHSHEMLYGFVSAPIAGFVLTAITNWTGSKPLNNRGLLVLVLLWIAGRGAMWFSALLPLFFASIIELAFLPVLAIYVFRTLWRHKNYRNMVLVLVLGLLFLGNLCMHMGLHFNKVEWIQKGQLAGFDLIILLIAIIAGRIIPAFTGNWLKGQGRNVTVHRWPILEGASLFVLAAICIADIISAPAQMMASLALLAMILHGVRLSAWQGLSTREEPLLWILHLAYLWLIITFALRASSFWVESVGSSVWQHAAGLGAIGTILLGVMTRVAMGHTGRELKLLRGGICIYMFISVSAVLRLLVALGVCDFRFGVYSSAAFWLAAFGTFVFLYYRILSSPRADGKPG